MDIDEDSSSLPRCPARVLGCLQDGWLTVILLPGRGLADGGILKSVPLEIIPFDLRMPNTDLTLLYDPQARRFVGVARDEEFRPQA